MNEFYYKFQKKLLDIITRLEKELLILKKDRDEINGIEFKELIDEKRLEYLNNEINLITTKIQKIENEVDRELRKIRIQNEKMLFVIYKTIYDLREYYINSDKLNEYIKLIKYNEELGLEDPLSENKFLLHFYKNFLKSFKLKLRDFEDSKPGVFKDEEIIYITFDNYSRAPTWNYGNFS